MLLTQTMKQLLVQNRRIAVVIGHYECYKDIILGDWCSRTQYQGIRQHICDRIGVT